VFSEAEITSQEHHRHRPENDPLNPSFNVALSEEKWRNKLKAAGYRVVEQAWERPAPVLPPKETRR